MLLVWSSNLQGNTTVCNFIRLDPSTDPDPSSPRTRLILTRVSATLVLGVVHFSPREPGKRAVLFYEGVGVLNIYSCDGRGGGIFYI